MYGLTKVVYTWFYFCHLDDSLWIWPDEKHPEDDRVISQMRYGLPELPPDSPPRPMKQILVYTGLRDGMKAGRQSFIDQKCPVTECDLTASRSASKTADLILWQNHLSLPSGARPQGQIWMVYKIMHFNSIYKSYYLKPLP